MTDDFDDFDDSEDFDDFVDFDDFDPSKISFKQSSTHSIIALYTLHGKNCLRRNEPLFFEGLKIFKGVIKSKL